MNSTTDISLKQVSFEDLGLLDYKQAWEYQEQLFNETVSIKTRNRDLPEEQRLSTNNSLLFCEHPHVVTLGKSGDINNLLLSEEMLAKRGIQFFKINRGGDITYHGPEQVVGYPILDLDQFQADIHKYMRQLEEVMILTLADYGIEGQRVEGATGVWLDGTEPLKARKICAMGVRTSRWVTMHGFALNVNNDLSFFDFIVPCGINDKQVTSLEKELGQPIDKEEVKERIKGYFCEVFGAKLV